MDELKACPFCGGEATQRDFTEPFVNGWVGCQKCHCFINWVKNGKHEAVAAWNRRAAPKNKATETPRCDRCGQCKHALSTNGIGWTYYCKLNGRDVGQSHFGHNSPRVCPLRAPGNKPLTLEQLKQMDGEPVWLVLEKSEYQNHYETWAILQISDKSDIGFSHHGAVNYYSQGHPFKAYAHKPEQEEK